MAWLPQYAPAEQPIKPVRSYHIHSLSKKFFKLRGKPGRKPWARLFCRIPEEIDVATLGSLPMRHRSDPNIRIFRAMFFAILKDLFAFLAQ